MDADPRTPPITLLTDFGTRDQYVGVMKGVIGGICPTAGIVDLSHEVEPYQIAQAAYLLAQSWRWFRPGTVHVAVVDPGVGSQRRAIAAAADGHRFVLPDNGLLSLLSFDSAPRARHITNKALFLHPVSRTFHGRDIFAPAAAHLAGGAEFESVGPPIEDWVRLPISAAPTVLHIDRFGNIVTSLRAKDHQRGNTIQIGDHQVASLAAHYEGAATGALFLIEGSGEYLEISLRQASAADLIGSRVGDPIRVLPEARSGRS